MIIYFAALIFMTLLGSAASFFLKKASGSESVAKTLLNPGLYLGGCLYLLSAVINIWILRYLDYSVVLPLTSLTYVWTIVLSYYILNERITLRKVLGLVLILTGAICLSMKV